MIRSAAYAALNHRQRLFVDAIMSGKTIAKAAIDAGYSARSAPQQGSILMRNPNIEAALREVRGPGIATVDEIQEFWTSSLRDKWESAPGQAPPKYKPMTRTISTTCPSCNTSHEVDIGVPPESRIKASELLAKSRGMLTINVKHQGEVKVQAEFYRDTSKWPLELAEAFRDLMKRFADEESEILAKVKAALDG